MQASHSNSYERLIGVFDALILGCNTLGLGSLAGIGALAAWFSVVAARRESMLDLRTLKGLHLVLWGLSSLGAALSGFRPFGHYFIMILPAWSLLAGRAIDAAGQAMPGQLFATSRHLRLLRWTLTVGLLASTIGPGLPSMIVRAQNYFHKARHPEDLEVTDQSLRIGHYIRENCPANRRILVWGFSPDIYVLSQRDPATRYSYTTFVAGVGVFPRVGTREEAMKRAVPGALEIFLREFRSNKPLYVVDASSGWFNFELFRLHEFPPTAEILSESYDPVPEFSPESKNFRKSFHGFRLYRRRDVL